MALQVLRAPPTANLVLVDSLSTCDLFRRVDGNDVNMLVSVDAARGEVSYMNLTCATGPHTLPRHTTIMRMEGAVAAHDHGDQPISLDVLAARRIGAAIPQPNGLTYAEEELGHRGFPIIAIKSIRERRTMGLKEAKELYDAAGIPRPT